MGFYDYKPCEPKKKEKCWDSKWDKDWDQDWDLKLDKLCGNDCWKKEKECEKDKCPIYAPTKAHVYAPTEAPTYAPTKAPTYAPTKAPTYAPTKEKTYAPAYAPTKAHTFAPTFAPTFTIVIAKGADHECIKPFLERGTEAMSQKSAESFMETFNAVLKKGGEYEYTDLDKEEPDNLKDSYETLASQVSEGLKDTQDKGIDENVITEFMKLFGQNKK